MDIYKSVYTQFRILQQRWNLEDPRFEDYLRHRLYGNMHDLLRYNLIHPKTTWTKEEQLVELECLADKIVKSLNI